MAKFGKHTLDVPNILGAYFERVHMEQGISFDTKEFTERLTEKILMI
jgi:hypothetical protein